MAWTKNGQLVVVFFALFLFFYLYISLTGLHNFEVQSNFVKNDDKIPLASDPSRMESLSSSLVRMEFVNGRSAEMVVKVDLETIEDMILDAKLGPDGANPPPQDVNLILHNPDLCKNSPGLKWIVYVHSSKADRRDMMRRTWANPKLFKDAPFKVVYLLGLPSSPKHQPALREEFEKYGDLIQGDFMDTYKNLTLKAVMGLKWLSTHCPNVPYVMKTDDDSFINIFEISKQFAEHRNKTSVIMCPVYEDSSMPVLRDRKTCMKWCVRKRELAGMKYFPRYCAGIAYIMSMPLVGQMYQASRSEPFFWIDDVYITGLLPRKVPDVVYVDLMKYFSLKLDVAVAQYKNSSEPLTYHIVHGWAQNKFVILWNELLTRLTPDQIALLNSDVSSLKVNDWMKPETEIVWLTQKNEFEPGTASRKSAYLIWYLVCQEPETKNRKQVAGKSLERLVRLLIGISVCGLWTVFWEHIYNINVQWKRSTLSGTQYVNRRQ